MHIIFYCISSHDPRNPKQLKDPRRELGISQISYLIFIKYCIAELHIIDLKEKEDNDIYLEEQNEESSINEEERIEKSVLEARFVAKKIEKLLQSDYQVFDKKEKKYRKISKKYDIIFMLIFNKGERMFNIEEELKKLPGKPGVYIMHDKDDKIIYVGKAISLKRRVKQYFRKNKKTQRIKNMVSLIDHFEYIVCDNEAEALVLECNLIKKNIV